MLVISSMQSVNVDVDFRRRFPNFSIKKSKQIQHDEEIFTNAGNGHSGKYTFRLDVSKNSLTRCFLTNENATFNSETEKSFECLGAYS